jgi:hypothetical protein
MGLILGVTALIAPIRVRSLVLRQELPLLMVVAALSALLVWDHSLSRANALVLLAAFAVLMAWSIRTARGHADDALAQETATELQAGAMPLPRALLWLVLGLLVLVGSSRLLVWGAVDIAQAPGRQRSGHRPDGGGHRHLAARAGLVRGCGRKGEDDIALGNVLGSGLFNTLAVVGMAGVHRADGRRVRRPHARPARDGRADRAAVPDGAGSARARAASTAGKRCCCSPAMRPTPCGCSGPWGRADGGRRPQPRRPCATVG